MTVIVTDEPEAPAFEAQSYAFLLPEHIDGSESRVWLGTVAATDPDGDAVRYELVSGNEAGRFDVHGPTGALFYTGSGEDFESGDGPYTLTVRADDGTHTVDTAVTVTVVDVEEAPAEPQGQLRAGGRGPAGGSGDERCGGGGRGAGLRRPWLAGRPRLVRGDACAGAHLPLHARPRPAGRRRGAADSRGARLPAVRWWRGRAGGAPRSTSRPTRVARKRCTTSMSGVEAARSRARAVARRPRPTRRGHAEPGRFVAWRSATATMSGAKYQLRANDITETRDVVDDHRGDASRPRAWSRWVWRRPASSRNAGDHDWFRVTLAANTTYRFDLKGLVYG